MKIKPAIPQSGETWHHRHLGPVKVKRRWNDVECICEGTRPGVGTRILRDEFLRKPERVRCLVCYWQGVETDIVETVDVLSPDGSCAEGEVCPQCGAWKYETGGAITGPAIIADDVPSTQQNRRACCPADRSNVIRDLYLTLFEERGRQQFARTHNSPVSEQFHAHRARALVAAIVAVVRETELGPAGNISVQEPTQ